MTSRWKKVWADFWGNPTRTTLTVLTIAVGTFAVGFTHNMDRYMATSMDSDFLSANPAEAVVYAWPLNDESVRMAREVPGVDAAEGRAAISAQILHPSTGKVSIQFTATEDPDASTVNSLKPALGQASIPPLHDRQILVDSSAATLGYKPGDLILIQLDDGTLREVHLAGYLHSPTGFPYSIAQFVTAFVTPETLVWLGGELTYNQVVVSVERNPTDAVHVTEVAQAVADRIEHSGATVNYVRVSEPGHHFAYSVSQGMFVVLGTLGWLTVLLGGVLIVNTITALMAQHRRQIGIMKATGAGNLQLFAMYAALIASFGAAALLLSIPLADKAANVIGDGMAAWLNFFPADYTGYGSSRAQQAIVALLVPLVAAAWPLYGSVRMTVREALSDYGLGRTTATGGGSVAPDVLRIPRPIRLSLRNAFRRKARLALTLFTLVLAGAVFIAVCNLWASFDDVIQDIRGYFLADINYSFARWYRFERVASIAQAVPGVAGVEGWLEYPGTLNAGDDEAGRQILFVAPPSSSNLIDPIIAAGRWLRPEDENAIVVGNHLLNMFPDLKVGDWLAIEIDGQEAKWQIVGVFTITGNIDVPMLYVNYEYISRLMGRPSEIYALRVITDQHDAASQQAVNERLQAAFESHGIRVGSTQLGTDFIQQQKQQTNIFVIFMLVMAVLIALVGGLGLMGTMGINVLERTREIGVMRAIGASNLDIQSIVMVEGIVVGLISWAVSIVLAFPITYALTAGVGMALTRTPLPARFASLGIFAWLIGILVLAAVASALPARRASRLTVKDTLAYE